jgi:cellular nucleic acid-binding protein
MSKTNIYILLCEQGKYYIGKTNNVIKRYQEHLNGTASVWTKKYSPILLQDTIENASPFKEDMITKEYMAKYGINNVRGGSYVSEVLDATQFDVLQREIWSATDRCINCGSKSHFVKNCTLETDNKIKNLLAKSMYIPTKQVIQKKSVVLKCYRCNRIGHLADECYAHTKINSNNLMKPVKKSSTMKCYRCKRVGHLAGNCYAQTNAYGSDLDSDSDSD